MAVLDMRIETGYGKVSFEESENFRIPQNVTGDYTAEYVMGNVKSLFNQVIRGDSDRGHLRGPSRFGKVMLVHHELFNCEVYSAQFNDPIRDSQEGIYSRGAVNFIEPTDERIDYPLVHAHHYALGQESLRETPAEHLSNRPLVVAQWLTRFAQNL